MMRASQPLRNHVPHIDLSGYRVTTYKVSLVADPPQTFAKLRGEPLRSAKDVQAFAVRVFPALGLDADREHFVLLALNNKHRFSGLKVISTGSMTQSLVHPREVFHAAIVLRAAAVIVIHNHPSGDPAASPDDIAITKRLTEIANVLGIRFLDHLIIGSDGKFFSFSDKAML